MKKRKVNVSKLVFNKKKIVPLVNQEKAVVFGGVSRPKPGNSQCWTMCFEQCEIE